MVGMPAPAPDALIRSRIFDGLTTTERDRWLADAAPVLLKRGQSLVRQGDPGARFYLIESGFLKLTQLTAEGIEVIVRFVGAGEPFGGVVALDKAEYPVTALAVQPTVVRGWSRERLRVLLDAFPQVRVNIMREMSAHMTDALTRVRELSTARVGQRLAHTLLRLTEQCGQRRPDGVLIPHALTRQDLAEMTGTTLYTVSRTLRRWEATGVVRSDGRKLIVSSTERLTALADDDAG
jgi:CRP-like cAMP-binding protein